MEKKYDICTIDFSLTTSDKLEVGVSNITLTCIEHNDKIEVYKSQ
jgi:hypothetical protein